MDLSRLELKPHKLFHHLEEVLKWKRGEYFPPIFIEFNVTDICNQKCWYCYTDYLGHRKDVAFDDNVLIKTFHDMGTAGVKSVMIQGTGEPTLHRALIQAIRIGYEVGLSISLTSNGVLLNKEKLEELLPCLEWIRISSVECNAQLYAKSHGCPESHWFSVVENLKNMVAIRNRDNLELVINCHFMLFPYNAEYVVQAVQLVKDIGVDVMMIKPGDQNLFNLEHKWQRDSHIKFRHMLEEAKKLETNNFIVDIRFDLFEKQFEIDGKQEMAVPERRNFDLCYGLFFEAQIDADGGVYPCNYYWRNKEFCYGDLNKQSFEEIWKSERRYNVIKKIFQEHDLSNCIFGCKQMHINKTLWKLANPPLHVNFL